MHRTGNPARPTPRSLPGQAGEVVTFASPAASIAEQVAMEAEDAARRRSVARMIGHSQVVQVPAMSAPEAIQAGFLDTPNDAMRTLITGWPDMWLRLIADSKAAGKLPGPYFVQALERGLDALAGER